MAADRRDLFVGCKALGLYSGRVPLQIRRHASKRQLDSVVVAVGGSLHQYNVQSLRLVSISDPLPAPISCVASSPSAPASLVFAAFGLDVAVFHYARQVSNSIPIQQAEVECTGISNSTL